jgi:hypothetical protein
MLKGRLQPLQNAFVGSAALDTLRDSDVFNQHRHVQWLCLLGSRTALGGPVWTFYYS